VAVVTTTILLARHGETEWNREGRFQGHADPPLNETGCAQARALADQLAATPIDAVYSSDLRRARQTAEVVAARHGVSVTTARGLREIDVGSWSGLTRAEIEQRFPGAADHDGETREAHLARVVATVDRIAHDHPGERLLVVSHGGSLRALEAFAGEPSPRPLANCETFTVEVQDGRVLLVEAPPPVPPRDPEADDAEALEER
jgi:broad specificity phosphatase PhoE